MLIAVWHLQLARRRQRQQQKKTAWRTIALCCAKWKGIIMVAELLYSVSCWPLSLTLTFLQFCWPRAIKWWTLSLLYLVPSGSFASCSVWKQGRGILLVLGLVLLDFTLLVNLQVVLMNLGEVLTTSYSQAFSKEPDLKPLGIIKIFPFGYRSLLVSKLLKLCGSFEPGCAQVSGSS